METRARVRRTAELAALSDHEEVSDEDFIEDECLGDDENIMEQSGSSSEEDESEGEEEAEESTPAKKRRPSFLSSKSGCKWARTAPTIRESRSSDVHSEYVPSLNGNALQVKTPLEAWSLLIDESIIDIVVIHTNAEIDRYIERGQNVVPIMKKHTDQNEVKAYFGLLYYAGLFKVNHTRLEDLWSVHSLPLFRAVMPLHRFKLLSFCIRFDDKDSRIERLKNDRLACIREIWDKFVTNCRENYTPGQNVTLDEQLLSFRGRCGFKIYIPAKPDKYGLKIVSINDAKTHYMFDAIPYVGSVPKLQEESVPSFYVRTLCKSIYNTSRTVVMDNWFTSIPIVKKMRDEYGLTIVGTIRKNKTEIPACFKKRPTDDKNYQFCYRDGMTLLSYNPKNKKIVLILSSLHKKGFAESNSKPQMVLFYNDNKGGTDAFDKKCHDYSVVRKTCRWPVRFMYGILDQAGVNAHILFCLNESNSLMTRHEFQLDLAMALVKPLMLKRLTAPTLQLSVRHMIESFSTYEERPEEQDICDEIQDNKLDKPKRCLLCKSSCDKKTSSFCVRCCKPMCRAHTAKVCVACVEGDK